MLRNPFTKTLYDLRIPFLALAAALAAYALLAMALYPVVAPIPTANEPRDLLFWAGIFAPDGAGIAAPSDWLNAAAFNLVLPVALSVFAIFTGSRAVAGNIEGGLLPLLLARPIRRRTLVYGPFWALALALTLAAALLWGVLTNRALALGLSLDGWKLAGALVSLLLLALCFGSLAVMAACLTGSISASRKVALAVLFASYLIYILPHFAAFLAPLRRFSPFYYYMGGNPLANGLYLPHALALAVLAAIFLAVGAALFEQKDI